jgi:hypothetical protein
MPVVRIGRVTAVLAVSVATGLAVASTAVGQDVTPPLPGAPPGAGADLPAPPGVRGLPAAPPPPAVAVNPDPAAPNLLSGTAQLARRTRAVTIRVFCRADGRVRLSAPRLGRGTLAVAGYRCRGRQGIATVRLGRTAARRLARLRSVLASVTLRQGAEIVRSALRLTTRTTAADQAPAFWSDGSLQCSPTGQPEAYLVAPNWTASPPTAIYIRPWVAAYNSNTGWQWIGAGGVRASRWAAVTATPAGVAEWQLPAGGRAPWTWGPIRMPLGFNTYAVGVFEVVYWWSGGPRYVWSYVRPSTTGLDASGAFCRYF